MAGSRLSKRHRRALEPFSETYRAFHDLVAGLSEAELLTLAEAADAVTTTNCGWDEFGAAQTVASFISARQLMIARRS